MGSNGETVFRLKGERAFEVDVWTFGRSTVDVGYFDPADSGASHQVRRARRRADGPSRTARRMRGVGGEGERPDRTGPVAMPARIGRVA